MNPKLLFLNAVATLIATTAGVGQQATSPSNPWQLQNATTKASLRGIHAVSDKIAWASGTNGTILRTEDGGSTWKPCTTPPQAGKLDFRGIWAWDAKTAVAMSSGPGDLSRLYKTTDGCSSWKLLYTNPDKDGFWDAIVFKDRSAGHILGDPVHGHFVILFTSNGGDQWISVDSPDLDAGKPTLGAFAASNSSIAYTESDIPWFGTSGPDGPYVYMASLTCTNFESEDTCWKTGAHLDRQKLPMTGDSPSAGAFSLAEGTDPDQVLITVGGDYKKPNESHGTAAWTADGGKTWTAATKPPHGYRSTVAWDASDKAWITAGTNGSDISYDNGKSWQPLDNGNWNALSPPWIVGPDGRVAKLVSLKLAAFLPK